MIGPQGKRKSQEFQSSFFKIFIFSSSWIFYIDVDFLDIASRCYLSRVLRFFWHPLTFFTQGGCLLALPESQVTPSFFAEDKRSILRPRGATADQRAKTGNWQCTPGPLLPGQGKPAPSPGSDHRQPQGPGRLEQVFTHLQGGPELGAQGE